MGTIIGGMMKIGVLIKQVPDTETRIKLTADTKGIDESTVKWVMNPYDEFAVEEALSLKGKAGGEVVIISAGPARATEAIRTALAMGADRGVRIDTEGVTLDSYLTAKVLSNVIKEEGLEIVFAGKQAADDDAAQVVQATAEMLGWPEVPVIETFEAGDGKVTVQTPLGGGTKGVYDVTLPAVLGCEKDLNKPRYASLPGIMKAKTKPIAEKKAADLFDGETAKVEVLNYSLPPEREAGKKVEGEPEEVAEQLVKYLREEIKVI